MYIALTCVNIGAAHHLYTQAELTASILQGLAVDGNLWVPDEDGAFYNMEFEEWVALVGSGRMLPALAEQAALHLAVIKNGGTFWCYGIGHSQSFRSVEAGCATWDATLQRPR